MLRRQMTEVRNRHTAAARQWQRGFFLRAHGLRAAHWAGIIRAMFLRSDPPIPNWPGLAGREITWARTSNLVTEPVRRIFAWWTEHAADGPPARETFDITAFGDIAENLYIIAGMADGFELRLAGEEYIRLFNIKRGWVWRHDATDPVMRDSAALLAFVAQSKRPLRTIGRLELIERHWVELEALICPLAPSAAGAPKFLGCTAALPQA